MIGLSIVVVNGPRVNQLMGDMNLSDDNVVEKSRALGLNPSLDYGDIENARCSRGMRIETLSSIANALGSNYDELVGTLTSENLPLPESLMQQRVFVSHKEGKYKETEGIGYLRLMLNDPVDGPPGRDEVKVINACCDVLLGARAINDYSTSSLIISHVLPSVLESIREQNILINDADLRRICVEGGATFRDSLQLEKSQEILEFAAKGLITPSRSDSQFHRRVYARNCEHLIMLYAAKGDFSSAEQYVEKLKDFTDDEMYGTLPVWIPRILDGKWRLKCEDRKKSNPYIDEMREITNAALDRETNEWAKSEAIINEARLDELEDVATPQERFDEIASQFKNVGPQRLSLPPTRACLPRTFFRYLNNHEKSLLRKRSNLDQASTQTNRLIREIEWIREGAKNRTKAFDMVAFPKASKKGTEYQRRVRFDWDSLAVDGRTVGYNVYWRLLEYALWRPRPIHYLEGYIIFKKWIEIDESGISSARTQFGKNIRNVPKSIVEMGIDAKFQKSPKEPGRWMLARHNISSDVIVAAKLLEEAKECSELDPNKAEQKCREAIQRYEQGFESYVFLYSLFERKGIQNLNFDDRLYIHTAYGLLGELKDTLDRSIELIRKREKDLVLSWHSVIQSTGYAKAIAVYELIASYLEDDTIISKEERIGQALVSSLRKLAKADSTESKISGLVALAQHEFVEDVPAEYQESFRRFLERQQQHPNLAGQLYQKVCNRIRESKPSADELRSFFFQSVEVLCPLDIGDEIQEMFDNESTREDRLPKK